MKKNKAMRLGSVMLVLALLTTCAMSGTFAKYVTSVSGTDQARVAYWGLNSGSSLTLNLFSKTYDSSVTGSDKVVAPGTKQNQLIKFTYTDGTDMSNNDITAPEVKYKLTVKAANADSTKTPSDSSTSKLDAISNFVWVVCPQSKFDTTTGLPTGYDSSTATTYTYQSYSDFIDAINALSGDSSGEKEYAAGSLPTGDAAELFNGSKGYYIGWAWLYDNNTGSTPAVAATNTDEADTEAGNATSLDYMTLKLDIGATQVD